MEETRLKNILTTLILTVCLGAAVGLILWLFLRCVALGTGLIWNFLPSRLGGRWITLPLCAAGGCLAGLLHKRYGDYPEELAVVLGQVKREKRYDYHPLPVLLACALLPLILGASVGPEAGLTGIIAALCCWVGDNVKFASRHAALYSEIGEAVTLGQIFHMPLFGILAVGEEPESPGTLPVLPRLEKLALYGLSAAAGFLVISLLNHVFHTSLEGFPGFAQVNISTGDYLLVLLYIPVGLLVCLLFAGTEKLAGRAAGLIPPVLREALCGLIIGLTGLLIPALLFSGEEQMAELIDGSFPAYAPWLLLGLGLLKLIMTGFCLRFGLRGGHFFPLIFACTCLGFGLAGLAFAAPADHVVFAAGVVTAAALGAQMKKPLAVSVLLLLCFPARLLFWIFLAAAVSGRLAQLLTGRSVPR